MLFLKEFGSLSVGQAGVVEELLFEGILLFWREFGWATGGAFGNEVALDIEFEIPGDRFGMDLEGVCNVVDGLSLFHRTDDALPEV
jgi:hypothetical protein